MPHDADFWQGKRVLVTGHTGFKGAWLTQCLQRSGAEVTGVALPPATSPNLFDATSLSDAMCSHFCDIRDAATLAARVRSAQPEVIFHLAAQPLVRASYRDPLTTYATNVMGTAHVLEAVRDLASLRVAVMVTTDKVYQNLEHLYPYREDDALGGHDPYSASKAACELVIASYRDAWLAKQGVAVASARAGNVIGGGDWSEDRLVPDAVRAWQAGVPLQVRNSASTRPWQHVLEPLHGYLTLAQRLWHQPELAGPYNFGPHTHQAASVRKVVELACSAYGTGTVSYQNEGNAVHEAGWLALETAKSRQQLGIQPCWSLADTVARTMAWYRSFASGADARRLCLADLDAYEADLAAARPIP